MSKYELLMLQKKMKRSFEQVPKIKQKEKNAAKQDEQNAEKQLDLFLISSFLND
jgi:hypothetical protein